MRIGKFGFLNNFLPYYWLEKQGYKTIEANPKEMAKMLGEKIDFAPIPSFHFLLNKSKLKSYDFCISSKNEVKSVLVVSKNKELDDGSIALTTHSLTSINLLKIILKEKGLKNKLVLLNKSKASELLENCNQALVIGDEAIKARMIYKVVMDLGEEWYELTGYPMVFGISASLKNFDGSKANELILKSIDWGLENLDEVVKAAESKFKMPREFLEDYFKTLTYKMSSKERKGLELFEVLCNEYGLLHDLCSKESK
ncbi:futalosine synthase [Archaeoglobales archaeon]|nr:MAG: futalosine synthase [Archaeoglobales archaeon]